MDESTHSFAQWLRHRRQALHLTQRQLGVLARCSEAMIRKIEAEERLPSREVAQHLAVALQVPERDHEQFLRWARGEFVHDPLPHPATEAAPERPLHAPFDVPTPLNALIGRQAELARTVAQLKQADVRLVTLTGTGGVGKTRLGIAVAEALRDVFADGIFFVNLAPVSDPALVLSTIATMLDVKETPGQNLLSSLQMSLHDRQLLLLLDNFEQVLDASVVVADLLHATPSVKVLVTSRASLRVQGEREVLVQPLAVPTMHTASPDTLAEYDATRLFLERARAMDATFEASADDARAIADICERLDGLPLAIELAAARIKVLPPQTLLRRLDEHDHGGFHMLTSGARDLPARQRTLQATIEWSYNLLDAPEQTILARLAVFVGGWTLEAAEAICDTSGRLDRKVVDVLESLLDKHLVRQVAPVGDQPRFGMLQAIREYAWERLAPSDEQNIVRRRHALYFRNFVEIATSDLRGPQQRWWLTHLEAEHDNVRAAIQWSLDSADNATAARLSGTLQEFWWMHGYLQEALRWLEKVLVVSDSLPAHLRAQILHATAWFSEQHDLRRAKRMYEESLALYRALDDKRGIADQWYALAGTADANGDYTQAKGFYEESLKLYSELGDKQGIAKTLDTLGYLLRIRGEHMRAKECHQKGLALRRELGDDFGIAFCLNSLGHVTGDTGDYVEATALYQEGLTIRNTLGDKRGIARSLGNLAYAWAARGDYNQAMRLNRESLTLARELGDKRAVAVAENQFGWILSEQGHYVQAIDILRANLRQWRELRELRGMVDCLERLAAALGASGQGTLAVRLFGTTTAWREARQMPRLAIILHIYEQAMQNLRVQLDHASFATAWDDGRVMSLGQASTYVLKVVAQQE